MKKYAHPFGATYPKTLADFKKAKARQPHERVWVPPCKSIEPPYPEIVPSWLDNGFKEVAA